MIRRRDRRLLTTRHWPLTPDTAYTTGTFKHRESRNKPATFSGSRFSGWHPAQGKITPAGLAS
jgi:hypothetical protein